MQWICEAWQDFAHVGTVRNVVVSGKTGMAWETDIDEVVSQLHGGGPVKVREALEAEVGGEE